MGFILPVYNALTMLCFRKQAGAIE